MWHLIGRVVSKMPATARHDTPDAYAQQLVNARSEQSTPANLPIHIQDALFPVLLFGDFVWYQLC